MHGVARYDMTLTGDVDRFLGHLDGTILSGSISANLEDSADHRLGDARMVLRVYERYSAFGGSRVSLSISVLAVGEQMSVTAIPSGGSQAMFWKVNRLGEESFLNKAIDAIQMWKRVSER